jgi:hypothetical protein
MEPHRALAFSRQGGGVLGQIRTQPVGGRRRGVRTGVLSAIPQPIPKTRSWTPVYDRFQPPGATYARPAGFFESEVGAGRGPERGSGARETMWHQIEIALSESNSRNTRHVSPALLASRRPRQSAASSQERSGSRVQFKHRTSSNP